MNHVSDQDRSAALTQVLAAGSTNYVYGAERLYGVTSGARTWELHDALGSVRRTTSGTTVSAPISDDASGQVRGGATLPRFGYTGELQDAATGQVFLRARWYNSASGRFGSRDTYAGNDRAPQSLHRYAYVHNDPLNATDPTGLWRFAAPITDPESWMWPHSRVVEHYLRLFRPSVQTSHLEYSIGVDGRAIPDDMSEWFRTHFPGKGGIYETWKAVVFNVDIIDTLGTPSNYEIKPDLQQYIVYGMTQTILDNVALNGASQRGLLVGTAPQRLNPLYRNREYNWNSLAFRLGLEYPEREFVEIVPGAELNLWAGIRAPGLIVYWFEDNGTRPDPDKRKKREHLIRDKGYVPSRPERPGPSTPPVCRVV